jgi:hypothetical protein
MLDKRRFKIRYLAKKDAVSIDVPADFAFTGFRVNAVIARLRQAFGAPGMGFAAHNTGHHLAFRMHDVRWSGGQKQVKTQIRSMNLEELLASDEPLDPDVPLEFLYIDEGAGTIAIEPEQVLTGARLRDESLKYRSTYGTKHNSKPELLAAAHHDDYVVLRGHPNPEVLMRLRDKLSPRYPHTGTVDLRVYREGDLEDGKITSVRFSFNFPGGVQQVSRGGIRALMLSDSHLYRTSAGVIAYEKYRLHDDIEDHWLTAIDFARSMGVHLIGPIRSFTSSRHYSGYMPTAISAREEDIW